MSADSLPSKGSEARFVAIPAGRDAYEQALHLRVELGLSYRTIKAVMEDYHGIKMPRWQTISVHCRRLGAPPKPHGTPIRQQPYWTQEAA
jgi:hypothetical protein